MTSPAYATDEDLSDFPKDVVENLSELFSTENLLPLLVGSTGTLVLHPLDHTARDYFQASDRFGDLDKMLTVIGGEYVVTGAAGTLFLLGRTSDDLRFQRMTYALAQGLVINNGTTLLAKVATSRLRPDRTDSLSFPSGHASNAFTIATVLGRFYGTKAAIAAYTFAALIGASRVSTNAHYLSDVIAGATLGCIVGRTVADQDTDGTQKYLLMPAITPGGFGVNLRIRF